MLLLLVGHLEHVLQRRDKNLARSGHPHPEAAGAAADGLEGLVHVVRDGVELALGVEVQAVVAGPDPVPVVVDQGHVEGQKPEQPVHVEDRFQRLFELVRRGLVEDFAHVDEGLPRLLAVRRLDLVPPLVVLGLVPEVVEAAAAAGAAPDLPAAALVGLVVLDEELLVELLDVGVDAPTLAVDDDLDEVRLRRRGVPAGEFGVQHGAQERRVVVRVEQVQRLVPVQPLLRVGEVQGQVERPLRPGRDHHVARHAAEVNADVRVDLAVHGEGRRHLDIGAVEVLHLGLPVLALEIEEQGAQHGRVVQPGPRVRRDVRRRHLRPGPRGLLDAPPRAEAAGTEPAGAALSGVLLERVAGRLSFGGV